MMVVTAVWLPRLVTKIEGPQELKYSKMFINDAIYEHLLFDLGHLNLSAIATNRPPAFKTYQHPWVIL